MAHGRVARAGAALHVPLDTRMRAAAGGRLAAGAQRVLVALEHLTSYEGMGMAQISCAGSCSCEPQLVDGHRVDAHRNVSVFQQHTFGVLGASAACSLLFFVPNRTSSGGHKFKLRTITVTPSE